MARKKVIAEPVLKDWAAVDGALRDIRECQHALTEMSVERDRRLDDIKSEYAGKALPLENRIKRLESDVKAYVDAHRAELTGKSRRLTFGTVGYRLSSKLILPTQKAADAIAILKAAGRYELLKITESLDREALKKQPETLLDKIGAYVQQSDTFFYDVQDPPVEN